MESWGGYFQHLMSSKVQEDHHLVTTQSRILLLLTLIVYLCTVPMQIEV